MMVEMSFKGASQQEIGEALGLTKTRVAAELREAERAGLVQEVRDKLLDQVQRTPGIYEAILNAPVKDLHDHSRGYKLKLDAANALNTGAGTFRAESHKTTEETWTLETIAREKSVGSAVSDGAQTRVKFLSEATAGTAVLQDEHPSPTATPAPSVEIVEPSSV